MATLGGNITARMQISGWIAALLADDLSEKGRSSYPEIAERVISKLREPGNEQVLDLWLRQSLPAFVTAVSQSVVTKSRDATVLLPYQSGVMTPEHFQEQVRNVGSSLFDGWVETASGSLRRFGDLRKVDLLDAAKRRRRLAVAHLRRAMVWERIAASMDDEHTVREQVAPEDVVRITEEVANDPAPLAVLFTPVQG